MTDQQRVPCGVRLKEAGKLYYYDAGEIEIEVGYYVVVDTSHGLEIGRVVIAPDQVVVSEIKESLKPILRRATPEDLEQAEELKKRAVETLKVVRSRAADDGLAMRIVIGEYSLDVSQLTFYFTSDDRVDFRTLSRALSSEMDTKVQFLQIGDRDRAKIVDGIGRCGERLCCSSWMGTFPTVSIKQAKEQDLPLNPSKLSGACGRLLCCLTYEYDQYKEIKGGLPKVGARISTPTGPARVRRINVPKETISLSMEESREQVEMPLTQFRLMYGTAVRPAELTEKFEIELMAADVAKAQSAGPSPAGPSPAAPSAGLPSPAAQQRSQQDARAREASGGDGQPSSQRRRRRRRGGRNRRRSGPGGPSSSGGPPSSGGPSSS